MKIILKQFKEKNIDLNNIKKPGIILKVQNQQILSDNNDYIKNIINGNFNNSDKDINILDFIPYIFENNIIVFFIPPIKKEKHFYLPLIGWDNINDKENNFFNNFIFDPKNYIDNQLFSKILFENNPIPKIMFFKSLWHIKNNLNISEKNIVQKGEEHLLITLLGTIERR